MTNAAIAQNHDEVRSTVAANLRAEFSRQRWTGRKVAVALGLTNPYVARRLSGETECSASDLVTFAGLLEIPVAKLFEGTTGAEQRTSD